MNGFEASMIYWIQENIRLGGIGDKIWIFITHLGDEGILWIAMGLVLLFWKRTRPIGCTVLLSLLFDFLIVNVALKPLIARPRPFVVNEAVIPLITDVNPLRSFPSGHSGGSFAAMLALYKWVPKKIGIPAVILAVLVAFSRLYMGVHYPTDILAGLAVGIVSSILANLIVRRVQKKTEEKKQING